MSLKIEKIKNADICFFPVDTSASNLNPIVGNFGNHSIYAKAYLHPFISNKLKIYRENNGVNIHHNDPMEPVFLKSHLLDYSLGKHKEYVEKITHEYHFQVINRQNKHKNKIWVFGLPTIVEALYKNFSTGEIGTYIYEINIREDRLFLISLEKFKNNNDLLIPNVSIFNPEDFTKNLSKS